MLEIRGKTLFACVTALTCNSFLLIGYDNGVLGGVIEQPAFNATFNTPDSVLLGLIVSLYEVGAFLGAVATAIVSERLGRPRSMLFGSIVMLVGAILQATSYSTVQMVVARIVSGVGMGAINSTAPVYQAEFSPRTSRGIYACAQLSTLNFGTFLAYWIGYGFAGIEESYAWRVPVILQCVFILAIMFLSMILPDTPRWLIAHDRDEQALSILVRLHGQARENEQELEQIRQAVLDEDHAQTTGFSGLFKDDGMNFRRSKWDRTKVVVQEMKSRRRLLIACSVQFFQQLGGINGINYYSGTIFAKSLGFDSHLSALMSGFLFTWFFVASFVPWALIETVGRRPLLTYSISFMAAVFACMAGMVAQIQYTTDIAHISGIVAAALLFLYLGAFTIGFQATVWVYPPEILPLRHRQVGTSAATACNWIINFMVVQITPIAITNIGWKYYVIFAVFNACFVPIVYFFYPETKGLKLEEVDQLFARQVFSETVVVEDDKEMGTMQQIEDVVVDVGGKV